MKKVKKNLSFDSVIVGAICLLMFGAAFFVNRNSSTLKSYEDENMSFSYNGNFSLDETSFDNIKLITIQNNSNKLIEIAAIQTDAQSKDLKQVILDSYPQITRSDLKKNLKLSAEGYEFSQIVSGDRITYNYFKKDGLIVLVKFYDTYYDQTNTFISRSNLNFLKDYYRIINSLEISQN